MTVLFVGRNPVAPLRDIANSFNTVANTVRSMRDGFTNFRQGITAWTLKLKAKSAKPSP